MKCNANTYDIPTIQYLYHDKAKQMEYILIPAKDKAEASFFLDLFKKMNKEASSLSSKKMEDLAFISALKEAEQSGEGSLSKVKAHLAKIASGK